MADKKEYGLTAAGTPRKRPPRKGEGRPSKYKPEYCDAIIDYFDRPPQRVEYKRTYNADGSVKTEEPIIFGEQIPTLQGFAHTVDTTAKTLWEWADKYPEFGKAYARAKELQEHILVINAMGGQYNSQFAQFFAKNNLGYKDKTEQEVTAKVITDADRALLDKVSKRLDSK